MKQKNQVELGSNGSKLQQEITKEMRVMLNKATDMPFPECSICRACMSAPTENPRGCAFYKYCITAKTFLLITNENKA